MKLVKKNSMIHQQLQKKITKLPQIKLNPALNIIKENHLENQEKFIYHIEIDEKELMDYIKSIKATLGSL